MIGPEHSKEGDWPGGPEDQGRPYKKGGGSAGPEGLEKKKKNPTTNNNDGNKPSTAHTVPGTGRHLSYSSKAPLTLYREVTLLASSHSN